MNAEDVILEVSHLEKSFGSHDVLRDISFQVAKGDVVSVIGASGSGKSTMLRCVNLLETPTGGSILYHGEDITDPKINVPAYRSKVGMVFQQPNPFPKSIYDNIAYGPRLFGVHKKAELDIIVEKALKQAAIWDEVKDRLKKSALGLSGGQQQRLCIARTLAVEPEVILMDEPTSALDPISTSRIEDLAIELKNDYTIIMVTHNMQQATRISDNTAFFLLGEMIEYDKTEQLFSMPKNKKTEDYITGRFG